MEFNEVYFYTATIADWIPLLRSEKFKLIVVNSLIYLVKKNKIKVYGFVIMPNHIHLIWPVLEMNGKETTSASFMKFTGHQFLGELRNAGEELLTRFKSEGNNRNHQLISDDDEKSSYLNNLRSRCPHGCFHRNTI